MPSSQPSRKSRLKRFLHWLLDPVPEPKALDPAHKKFAFIKRGRFSYINTRVSELLAEHFPDYELEMVDVEDDVLRRNKGIVAMNVMHVFRIYGWDILRGKRTLRDCFYRTPYIFKQIKLLMGDYLGFRRSEFAFSIQTQSLYDGSVTGLPHFVYTDHTHLTNLYYPAFDAHLLFTRDWIDHESEIYRTASRVFIMSNHVGRSLVEHYGVDPHRVSCVFAGSNVEILPRPLKNSEYRNQHIVFVGVDWERKGGPVLIEAFKLVRQQLPSATLAIVGCEPKISVPGVKIVGRVLLTDVATHLVEASVFCMPTKVEPFGIAPIEALAHKLPVVATRIGALPDVVQHGKSGLLVAADSTDELAIALIGLLSDPDKCRRFGEHGQQMVKECYTWKAVGLQIKAKIADELAVV